MSELGLREIKKQRTRAAIQTEAMRLFTTQGYERTTCEQVAAAAEVSPATLFRYFADKEALVLDDDYEPSFFASLDDRPEDEQLIPALRAALADALPMVYANDADLIRSRMELVLSVPALRARFHDQSIQPDDRVLTEVARRLGAEADSVRVRAVTGAIAGAFAAASTAWIELGGELPDVLDQALAALEHDLGPGSSP